MFEITSPSQGAAKEVRSGGKPASHAANSVSTKFNAEANLPGRREGKRDPLLTLDRQLTMAWQWLGTLAGLSPKLMVRMLVYVWRKYFGKRKKVEIIDHHRTIL